MADRRAVGLVTLCVLASACGRSPLDVEDFGGSTGGIGGVGGATGGVGGSTGGFGGATGGVGGSTGGIGGATGGVGGSTGGFGGATGGVGGSTGGIGGVGGSTGGIGGVGGAGSCGDGNVGPGEQCDLGATNADRPALRIRQGQLQVAVHPVDTSSAVQLFYDHFSASSHTGFEKVMTSRLLLHRDVVTGNLSLVIIHGIDQTTTGISQPSASAAFNLYNLPAATVVAVADDGPSEFAKVALTSAQGNWTFQNNSDGGAIAGLPFPGQWAIQMYAQFTSGITAWEAAQSATTFVPLSMSSEPVWVEAFSSPSKCRSDCTIPECGDLVLDGGEVCDDGNTVGGDGCAADCKSLK